MTPWMAELYNHISQQTLRRLVLIVGSRSGHERTKLQRDETAKRRRWTALWPAFTPPSVVQNKVEVDAFPKFITSWICVHWSGTKASSLSLLSLWGFFILFGSQRFIWRPQQSYDSKQSVGWILKYSALLFFKCTNRTISLGFICWTQFRVMNRPKCWHYYIFWQQSRLIEMIELCVLIVWNPGNWTSSVSDSNLSSFNLSLYRFLWKH